MAGPDIPMLRFYPEISGVIQAAPGFLRVWRKLQVFSFVPVFVFLFFSLAQKIKKLWLSDILMMKYVIEALKGYVKAVS